MTPKDMVLMNEVRSEWLTQDLLQLLGEPKAIDCLMLRPPTRLIKRNPKTMYFYVGMTSTVYICLLFFTFPCKSSSPSVKITLQNLNALYNCAWKLIFVIIGLYFV